jgi:hypothetical protein
MLCPERLVGKKTEKQPERPMGKGGMGVCVYGLVYTPYGKRDSGVVCQLEVYLNSKYI